MSGKDPSDGGSKGICLWDVECVCVILECVWMNVRWQCGCTVGCGCGRCVGMCWYMYDVLIRVQDLLDQCVRYV